MSMHLEIVTPERRLLSVDADTVRAPGIEGSFGVLMGHTPYVAALEPGELRYTAAGREHRFFVGGGFAQVGGNRVVILAESAEAIEAIDLERAERALAEAMATLQGMQDEDEGYVAQQTRVQRAAGRVDLAKQAK